MLSFNLFSNRRQKKRLGISLDSLNGNMNTNNILIANLVASQKKQSMQGKPRMFKGSMINYVNSPSATCGCGKN